MPATDYPFYTSGRFYVAFSPLPYTPSTGADFVALTNLSPRELSSDSMKFGKISLLDRATTHIKYLEMAQSQLSTRLQRAETGFNVFEVSSPPISTGIICGAELIFAELIAAYSGRFSFLLSCPSMGKWYELSPMVTKQTSPHPNICGHHDRPRLRLKSSCRRPD